MKFLKSQYKLIIILTSALLLFSDCSSYHFFAGTEIPIKQMDSMRFIEIILNGEKTNLLIDTGASKSILDISQASRFNFQFMLFRENQYVGIGGKQDLYIVFDYEIEGIFLPFLGTDLREVTYYFQENDIDIAGIIGMDFLERYNVTIDFENNKLYYNRFKK